MKIGAADWNELIRRGAAAFGLDLDQNAQECFASMARELVLWNRKINLTSITKEDEIAEKHFIDSLAIHSLLERPARVLDIGTGAGFPGIPLKIVLPHLDMTLIDASAKKISFVKHIIRILALEKIQALHVRAEQLKSQATLENKFDVIICRAFSALKNFLALALPLLDQKGVALALKGSFPFKELEALGGDNVAHQSIFWNNRRLSLDITTYQLPFSKGERSLVQIRLH